MRVHAILLILLNVVVLFTTWKLVENFSIFTTVSKDKTSIVRPKLFKRFGDLVTIIIRDFQLDRNDLVPTIRSFSKFYPGIKIYIVSDESPYPPLEFDFNTTQRSNNNVKIVYQRQSFNSSYIEKYPLLEIYTRFILFLLDSTRLPRREIFDYILYEASRTKDILAIPVTYPNLKCIKVTHKPKVWSIKYETIKEFNCDLVTGKHAMLLSTDVAKKLPNALLAPFPFSLYLQTSYLNHTVRILQGVIFHDGKPSFENRHVHWMRKQEEESLKTFYRNFRVKLINEDGIERWYGCTKNTTRCFPPVIGSNPSYLYENRWTPPCCLANLRKTALHVFKNLDDAGIRYWLEGGSLLGAMRHGDILPWDHDVDVGVNSDDVSRCVWFERARKKPAIDSKGFLWERAGDGVHYRVNFSRKNKIFVNVYGFYVKNGTMVRDGWMSNGRNDEFPDHFLHPMSSIAFVGRHVPSPNNIRDFLEIKFGKGVVENPKYPDEALKYP